MATIMHQTENVVPLSHNLLLVHVSTQLEMLSTQESNILLTQGLND